MKICVAGQGAFGQKHLDALKRIQGVEIVSLIGGNPAGTEEVAKKYGVPHWGHDLAEGIKRADAVILATPTQMHRAQGEQVMRAGKPVLIEIPIADNVEDAEALAKIAKETGVIAMARPRAALQSQPSMGPQAHQEGRAEDPADGRADLFLPPHEHERGRQAAQLDRSSPVAPRRPHDRSLPLSDRRDDVGMLRRPGPAPPARSASPWTWAS